MGLKFRLQIKHFPQTPPSRGVFAFKIKFICYTEDMKAREHENIITEK